MNTLDLVQQVGGRPNNFLDIGGGASAEKVRSFARDDPERPRCPRRLHQHLRRQSRAGGRGGRGIVQARDELGITAAGGGADEPAPDEEEGRRILAEAGIVPGTSAPEAGAPDRRAGGGRPLMAILLDASNRVLVQGIDRPREGASTPSRCRRTAPRWSPAWCPAGAGARPSAFPSSTPSSRRWPRRERTRPSPSFRPPFAADAVMEAAAAGLRLGICVTEGIPVLDMVRATAFVDGTIDAPDRAQLPGGDDPGAGQDRFHPQHVGRPGRVGVVGAERHPHLRGDPGPLRIRVWRDDGGGNRGRTRFSAPPSSTSSPSSRRPRDRGGGAGRRDRGVGRGEGAEWIARPGSTGR